MTPAGEEPEPEPPGMVIVIPEPDSREAGLGDAWGAVTVTIEPGELSLPLLPAPEPAPGVLVVMVDTGMVTVLMGVERAVMVMVTGSRVPAEPKGEPKGEDSVVQVEERRPLLPEPEGEPNDPGDPAPGSEPPTGTVRVKTAPAGAAAVGELPPGTVTKTVP